MWWSWEAGGLPGSPLPSGIPHHCDVTNQPQPHCCLAAPTQPCCYAQTVTSQLLQVMPPCCPTAVPACPHHGHTTAFSLPPLLPHSLSPTPPHWCPQLSPIPCLSLAGRPHCQPSCSCTPQSSPPLLPAFPHGPPCKLLPAPSHITFPNPALMTSHFFLFMINCKVNLGFKNL